MEILQALILGIIQGVTEFLPISSSGHLILIPYFLQWKLQPLAFDVILHLGTLLAILLVFWKDWLKILKSLYLDLNEKNLSFEKLRVDSRIGMLISVGSIPAAILGFTLKDLIESIFRNPLIVAFNLIAVGLLMIWVERKGKVLRPLRKFNPLHGLLVGVAQSFALIPGVSRSGITIVAGIFFGLEREEAARFSFLLATPVIFGAGLNGLWELIKDGGGSIEIVPLIVGFLSSVIVGFVAIKLLLAYLKEKSLVIFAIYRFALAMIVVLVYLFLNI